MRIVAITMVKNEIDIIEAMVRHTTAVADHLVVLDHASADGTRDILESLRREGLPLDIVHSKSPAKRQGEIMTRLMQEHALDRHAADWIMPLDADEFVQPDRAAILAEAERADLPVGLPVWNYVARDSDDSTELNPALRITNRRRTERRQWYKVFVPAAIARASDARLTEGNHELSSGERTIESRPARSAGLAHFPVRSPGQYIAKIAIGHLSRLVIPERRSDWGYHYRKPFEQLKTDPVALAASYAVPTPDDLDAVRDPIAYLGGPLRYTPLSPDHWRPAQSLACFAEHIATEYAATTAGLPLDDRQFISRFAATLSRLYARSQVKDDALIAQQSEIERLRVELQQRELSIQTLQSKMNVEIDARDQALNRFRNSWIWRARGILVSPAAILKRAMRRTSRRTDVRSAT